MFTNYLHTIVLDVEVLLSGLIQELQGMKESSLLESGRIGRRDLSDLLDEAIAVSKTEASSDADQEVSSPRFTPQQIENLFWAIVDAHGFTNCKLPILSVGNYYIDAYVY